MNLLRELGAERARAISADAHRVGFLTRQPCVECGAEPADGHHPDYNEPPQVAYLCAKHHGQLHARLRKTVREDS